MKNGAIIPLTNPNNNVNEIDKESVSMSFTRTARVLLPNMTTTVYPKNTNGVKDNNQY